MRFIITFSHSLPSSNLQVYCPWTLLPVLFLLSSSLTSVSCHVYCNLLFPCNSLCWANGTLSALWPMQIHTKNRIFFLAAILLRFCGRERGCSFPILYTISQQRSLQSLSSLLSCSLAGYPMVHCSLHFNKLWLSVMDSVAKWSCFDGE